MTRLRGRQFLSYFVEASAAYPYFCAAVIRRPPRRSPRQEGNRTKRTLGLSPYREKFEIVKKMSKKRSTTVIHGGHSTQSLTKTESTFTTVEPQRVAAVVARSALTITLPTSIIYSFHDITYLLRTGLSDLAQNHELQAQLPPQGNALSFTYELRPFQEVSF